MQVVIDISDEIYQTIKEINMVASGRKSGRRIDILMYILFNAVKNGTPLSDYQKMLDSIRLEGEKYCDRNICIKNEYNGIGCDKCEVTKSQRQWKESDNKE